MSIGYGIFSGGLDSMLAALVLSEQGIEVRLLTFVTPFFGPDKPLASGRVIGLVPRVIDLTEPHLKMVEKPRYGFGRFMNPCIDCHALMFRRAGEIMSQEGGDFLFSGEVLGQRPKSQNRQALDIVARESGFADRIVRPLSGQLLGPTKVEEAGLVDRGRLLSLSGRTRKPQMELAAARGVKNYPTPAGGCLLTDPIFSRRLKHLMDQGRPLEVKEVELLKWGRHFQLPGGHRLVVGRRQAENEALLALAGLSDIVLKAVHFPGPTALLISPESSNSVDPPDLALAAAVTLAYSDAPVHEPGQVRLLGRVGERVISVKSMDKNDLTGLMI